MRRARAPRKARAPRSTGSYAATSAGVGGGELVQAAEEIADGARENAAWSRQVVASIRTEQVSDTQVNVVADAPPAYPGEVRARHPLFGNRHHWYGPPGQSFLAPAAESRAGAAMDRFAQVITRKAMEAGFR